MAKGEPFPQANLLLKAPTPEDAAAGTVYDLAVYKWADLDGRPHVISRWRLSPEELEEVNRTGGVLWLQAWGDTPPPVSIDGETPFLDDRKKRAPSFVGLLDVKVELVATIFAFMPGTIRVVGSQASGFVGELRLVLDVSATGQPGGRWKATVHDVGASRRVTFSPWPDDEKKAEKR